MGYRIPSWAGILAGVLIGIAVNVFQSPLLNLSIPYLDKVTNLKVDIDNTSYNLPNGIVFGLMGGVFSVILLLNLVRLIDDESSFWWNGGYPVAGALLGLLFGFLLVAVHLLDEESGSTWGEIIGGSIFAIVFGAFYGIIPVLGALYCYLGSFAIGALLVGLFPSLIPLPLYLIPLLGGIGYGVSAASNPIFRAMWTVAVFTLGPILYPIMVRRRRRREVRERIKRERRERRMLNKQIEELSTQLWRIDRERERIEEELRSLAEGLGDWEFSREIGRLFYAESEGIFDIIASEFESFLRRRKIERKKELILQMTELLRQLKVLFEARREACEALLELLRRLVELEVRAQGLREDVREEMEIERLRRWVERARLEKELRDIEREEMLGAFEAQVRLKELIERLEGREISPHMREKLHRMREMMDDALLRIKFIQQITKIIEVLQAAAPDERIAEEIALILENLIMRIREGRWEEEE